MVIVCVLLCKSPVPDYLIQYLIVLERTITQVSIHRQNKSEDGKGPISRLSSSLSSIYSSCSSSSATAMNNHDPVRTSSLSSLDIKHDDTDVHDIPNPPPPPAPTFKLLFSFLTPRRKLVLLTPAIASSVAAGGIAPFMTYVVGQSFNAFAAFPLTPHPSQAAKDALLHGVGLAALELVALGCGALLMSSVTSSLWIWTGEWNVIELRRKVYHAVVHNQMEWFDRQMGSDNPTNVQDMGGEGAPIGAGGLMAKFAR